MAGTPSLFAGIGAQFFTNDGVPLAGGKISSFLAGTTTPVATYTDNFAVQAHSNPIILDSAGRVPSGGEIWLKEGSEQYYKFVLEDSSDVLIATYDFVPGTYSSTDLANTSNSALGDALVGFRQSNSAGNLPNAIGRTVHQKLQENISVKDFGAVGDGVTDDSAAIQAADNGALSSGAALYFEGDTYLIKTPLTISVPWIGVAGKTTIKISSDFAYPTTSFDPRRYSAITNLNCNSVFNSSTADNVYISGFQFLDGGGVNGKDTIGLANVKGGRISDCIFTTETNEVRTLVDFFACVKNFSVENTKIYNLTQNSVGGGGMWIRNITGNGAISTNVTENINVVDCYFEHTTVDEAFAIYGVLGLTKNVRVSRCTFNGAVSSSTRHGNLVTAFPLGSSTNAAVQDVVFSECRFESNNFINHVLRIGESTDATRICKDIRVESCYFKASMAIAGGIAVARNIPCVGGNVTFANNIVDAEGATVQIPSGVLGFNIASNSTVLGNLTNAFNVVSFVDACVTKSITGTASFNCARVSNCTLSSESTAIVNNVNGQFDTINNRIEVTGTSGVPYGIFYNTVSSSAPFGEITGNIISLNNANAVAIRVTGSGVSASRANNNVTLGTGKTIQGTQFKEVQGNNWYGTLDSMRSAGYLDFEHNNATPIGTYTSATTHTAGTTRYLLGYIKTANAGISTDWKSVFVENANN
jgi:hypothetical protein